MEQKSFFITTPIYYVNDRPHIGHAYTSLACDVMARFKRLDGYAVHFLTGTDEHGQKVDKAAQNKNMSAQEFTDEVSQYFKDLTGYLNLSIDDFIRTTQPRHHKAVQALWDQLMAEGHIYLGSYAGWYAVRDEAFYGEDELTVIDDGSRIAPSGAAVEWIEEPSYFFNLSQWQEPLLNYYKDNSDFIGPKTRLNEVISFVEGGLNDLSISRTSFAWGVKVPNDPKHIMYVWLDALANYLTSVKYPDQDDPMFQQFWPASMHMVGKDILRFHAVYWPAFLMAAKLPLPKRVFAHGWWTNEGHKISKSTGNVIDPLELIETYGLDPIRYFLMREVPFGQDGNFSRRALVERINHDLANDLGNLAQRVLSMIYKHCDQKIPDRGNANEMEEKSDQELLNQAAALLPLVRDQIDQQAFHRALEEIWKVISLANRYIDQQAPWTLRKENLERMNTVLYNLADVIRMIALLVIPFMPNSAHRILDQLALGNEQRDFTHFTIPLPSGIEIPQPEGVFPRHVANTPLD